MKNVQLNEEKLMKIISESVNEVLKESLEDEGFWNNLKSGIKGAKQGFNAQKTLDRGTEDFKQYHDHDDAKYEMQHPMRKSENTAAEQAKMIYQQYKEYQAQANKLLSQYNQLAKKYGLEKQGVGQMTSTVKPELGGGLGTTKPWVRNSPTVASTPYNR